VVTAGVPANYTGGPTAPFDPNPKGVVYSYNTVERGTGDRTLNVVDF